MSTSTSIEWTSATWNPIRARTKLAGKVGWHCEKVSAGCANCYAETFNGRRLPNGGTGLVYTQRARAKVETYIDEDVLAQPLRWRKPRKVFVCSMTDLFGEWVSDEQLDRVFAVMALCPHLTFQVLTKRAERMRDYLRNLEADEDDDDERLWKWLRPHDRHWPDWSVWTVREGRGGWPFDVPPSNVWLGVSIEDQATADERIPLLLDTPAAVRFVSCEPLLGPIDLTWLRVHAGNTNALLGVRSDDFASSGVPGQRTARISWVIVGGESGPGARPCNIDDVRSIVAQCKAAGVRAFVKQLGAAPTGTRKAPTRTFPEAEGEYRVRLRDPKGGDMEEWPSDLRVREFPKETPCPS